MALIDGKKFSDERLMDAAGHVLHAYYRAPEITSRLGKQAVVISGDELLPILELIERTEEKVKDGIKNLFMPMYMDYMCLKVAIEEGYSPVLVAMGANYSKADLGWDCGACGFPTCKEFLKYHKKEAGMGNTTSGPTCAWKVFDHGIAVDYACASAHELNVENRILGTLGSMAMHLGYLDNVDAVWALAMGPQKEMWWYNRPSLKKWLDPEVLNNMLRNSYTNHFQSFSTRLRPQVKKDGPWWEQPPEFVKEIGPDPEGGAYMQEVLGALFQSIQEVRPKVELMKGNLDKMPED